MNEPMRRLYCAGVSLRRIAILLKMSRTTVARKLIFLGLEAEHKLDLQNERQPKAKVIEFDDMETFEHTKCKPLSVPLAVVHESRWILGFEVAQMPAKGKIAKMAFKKYGFRKDERRQARDLLFSKIKKNVCEDALIKSDQNPHYPKSIKVHFPKATHEAHPGQRGSIVGQGELKKIRFDPLFSLNHTCAMFRANVNRLFRRTWCTTKKRERLALHLAIFAVYHNEMLEATK